MRVIRLYGELGNKFGERFELDVQSPAEAVRALCVLLKGFQKYLLDSEKDSVGFKVFDAGQELDEQGLHIKGSGEIKFVPVIAGANGEARVIAGAVLIVASVVMTATGFGAAAAPYVMNAGIALVIGGALEMIIGKPKVADPNDSENKVSYLFNGAVNTTAQGHPVPIGYGRLRVGSAVISASVTNKSIMSGYRRVKVERWIECVAYVTPDSFDYLNTPPPGWVRRELIEQGQYYLEYWKYRYFYLETQLEWIPE